MNIRLATENDSQEISSLVIEAAYPHRMEDFNTHGWNRFININSIANTASYLKNEEYFTLCCTFNNQIAGIITVKNSEKVDQLFVLPQFRNKRIAQELWLRAKEQCQTRGNSGRFWVKSSSLAIPVYQKFGFICSGECQITDGTKFQLMTLNPNNES